MRRLYTLFFLVELLLTINSIQAQTIYNNAQDGKLYFQIKSEAVKHMIWANDKVDIDKTKFLSEINRTYNLNEVDLAFHLDKSSEELDRIFKVHFQNPSQIDQLIKTFENYSFIEYAERVPLHKLFHTPNDPNYSTTAWGYDWNWHLDMINAEQAWDISTGNSDIKVAVVDGAIWSSHPDLQNKIVGQYYGGSGASNSNPPTSVSQSSSASAYEWSHGTHCAGLVAAETNNSTGIAAIGYDVSLMVARAASDGGSLFYTSEGVQWAANGGADVISMSYGGTSYSSSENTLMNTIKNNGIVLVAAAGNEGDAGNEVNYPAGYTAVISVGSVNNDFELSSFSQHGSWVDIAAPGGFTPDDNGQINVLSTTYTEAYYLSSVPQFSGTYYDGMQGTSMATPIVSGLCGLLLSINPNLTPDEVKACLMNNAQAIATSGNSINSSSGCIDAYASAQCAQNSASLNAEFNASSTSITEGESVTFTDLSTDGGTTITSWTWAFPGGTPSSYTGQTPPSITYDTPGDYNVSLTVNNGSTDTELKNDYIHVEAASTSYCPSSGSTQYATSITLVNFGSINNATGQSNAYEDYTSISTDVAQGSNYNLTINVNTDGNYTVHSMVWIDWNQDYDFDDAGEEYVLGTAVNTADGATSASPYSVSVPANAVLGTTRMRVSAKYDAQATACEEGYDGEVEDYSINVTSGGGSSGDCNDLSSDYTMGFETGEDLTNWLLEDANGDDSTWTIFNSATYARTGSNVAAVKYHASNAANDWLFTPCLDLNSNTSYELSFWYRTFSASYPEKMDVYIGSTQSSSISQLITDLGTVTSDVYTESSNQFTVPSSGEYYIGFRTYSDANMAYLFIDDILIRTTNVAIEENLSENNFKIYPNPSNGLFTIELNNQGTNEVSIYNLKGELVFNTVQAKKEQTYDLSTLAKSVYFIKIVNRNYTQTQRLIIE